MLADEEEQAVADVALVEAAGVDAALVAEVVFELPSGTPFVFKFALAKAVIAMIPTTKKTAPAPFK